MNAATNIQASVDVATANDTVLVTNGTYYPADQISVTNDITVKSVNGAENTIVDGNNTNRCFYLDSDDTIEGFTILNGSSTNSGGGVYLHYGGTVNDCIISGNYAFGTAYNEGGGGVYSDYMGMVQNCIISKNMAVLGGGVFCFGVTEWNFVINCNVSDNTASMNGGGVYGDGGGMIHNCVISNNFALENGGGVYFKHNGTLRNCVISENSVSNYGGGVYCWYIGTVLNSTISRNTADNYGGVYFGFTCKFLNSILWNNINDYHFESDLINQYNCIEGWTNLVDNIITNNPEFVDAAFGNYRLESFSPCIDAGTNMSWMTGDTDLDGNPRIIGGIVDMGAYEFVPEPCLFIIYHLIFIIYWRKIATKTLKH